MGEATDRDWITTQIGPYKLFQVQKRPPNQCRVVDIDMMDCKMRKFTDKTALERKRIKPALCSELRSTPSMTARYAFLTGASFKNDSKLLLCAERYDVQQDRWEALPKMIKMQSEKHSSCVLGDTLYIFSFEMSIDPVTRKYSQYYRFQYLEGATGSNLDQTNWKISAFASNEAIGA